MSALLNLGAGWGVRSSFSKGVGVRSALQFSLSAPAPFSPSNYWEKPCDCTFSNFTWLFVQACLKLDFRNDITN